MKPSRFWNSSYTTPSERIVSAKCAATIVEYRYHEGVYVVFSDDRGTGYITVYLLYLL